MNVQEIVNNRYGKGIAQCSNEEIYYALLEMTKSMAKEKESNEGKRKLYYISAEFLIGKLLSNNLINLGIYEEVKQVLAENGKNLAEIEEVEPEPSLGNGGLGRLAACFLDSIATLGLTATAWVSIITTVCSNRYLSTIYSTRSRTRGSRRRAG